MPFPRSGANTPRLAGHDKNIEYQEEPMKLTFSLAAAALLVSGAAFAVEAPKGDAAKGKEIFSKVGCYQCHGFQGQGGREGPRIADPVPLAWPAFLSWVRTTSGDMPPFTEKVLPEQDLVDIYAYIQSVPKAPDFKDIPILSGMSRTASAQ
jgi:mono/diheme cytochrome c family protein